MGAAALSVAALLAILVTYRFTPLIDEASRRAAETDSRTSRAGEMEAAKSKDAEEYVPIPAPPEAQPVPTAAPFFSDVLTENQTNVATGSRSEIAGGEFRPAPPPIHAPESTPAQPAAPPLEARPETDRQVIAPPQASKSEKRDARSDVSPAAASAMQATVGPRSVLVVARSNLDVSWRLTGTRIERSDDAGKTWLRQPAPVGAALLAGSAPSDLACWAAGASGTLLRTRDGHEWMRLVSPTSDDIVQVTAWSALNASIRTAGGERFATDDGGQTWSRP